MTRAKKSPLRERAESNSCEEVEETGAMMPRCSITIQLHVVMIEICFINISSDRSENKEFSMRSWFTRHQHAGLLYGYASLRRKPRWHCLHIARDALRIIDHVIVCTLEKQLLDTGVSLRQRLDDDERPMVFITEKLLLLQEQVNAIRMRRRVAQLTLIKTHRTQQRAGWPAHIGQRCDRVRTQLGQMALKRVPLLRAGAERHQRKHAHGAQQRNHQLASFMCMVKQGYLKRRSKKKARCESGLNLFPWRK